MTLEETMRNAMQSCLHSEPCTPDLCIACATGAAAGIIASLTAQLENVLDTSKEGGWMARALDAERELHLQRAAASGEVRLSKRQIYAAEALHGLLANPAIGPYDDAKVTAYALSAVRCADALLLALGDA